MRWPTAEPGNVGLFVFRAVHPFHLRVATRHQTTVFSEATSDDAEAVAAVN